MHACTLNLFLIRTIIEAAGGFLFSSLLTSSSLSLFSSTNWMVNVCQSSRVPSHRFISIDHKSHVTLLGKNFQSHLFLFLFFLFLSSHASETFHTTVKDCYTNCRLSCCCWSFHLSWPAVQFTLWFEQWNLLICVLSLTHFHIIHCRFFFSILSLSSNKGERNPTWKLNSVSDGFVVSGIRVSLLNLLSEFFFFFSLSLARALCSTMKYTQVHMSLLLEDWVTLLFSLSFILSLHFLLSVSPFAASLSTRLHLA